MTYRRSADAIHDRIVARLKAQPSEPAPLQMLCAWCGVMLRPGRLTLDGHCSHGICKPCAKKHFGTDA